MTESLPLPAVLLWRVICHGLAIKISELGMIRACAVTVRADKSNVGKRGINRAKGNGSVNHNLAGSEQQCERRSLMTIPLADIGKVNVNGMIERSAECCERESYQAD